MHYFLYLELEGLYTSALAPSAGRCLLIHHEKRVLDADPIARAQGVRTGMSLSEAKLLVEGAVLTPWTPALFHEAQERWLHLCNIVSDRIEVESQHSAWVDLSLHANPVEIACQLKLAIETRLNVTVAIGLGGSKWVSKVAAQCMRSRGWPQIAEQISLMEPVLRPIEFLAPLPIKMLLPVFPEHRQRLLFLGYPTIGEVSLLPYELLHAHFGPEAFRIVQSACGGYYEPIHPNYPPECLSDRFEFPGSAHSLEIVDYGLQRIAKRIGKLLSDKEKQGNDLRLWFDREDSESVVRTRQFAKPFYDPPTTLTALRLLAANAPRESIQRLRVQAPHLTAVSHTQSGWIGQAKQERQEKAVETVDTLRKTFGEGSVQLAVNRMLTHREQVMRAWKNATGWR